MKIKKSFKKIKEERWRINSEMPLNFWPLAYISPYFSYVFINFLSFSADQITLIWGIIGLIGTFFIVLGGYTNFLIGILIFHFGIIFDMIDGAVARVTKKTFGGPWIDTMFHYIPRGLLLSALGIGIYNSTGQIVYLYLGVFSGFLFVFDNLIKLKAIETFVLRQKYNELEKTIVSYEKERGNKLSQKGFFSKLKLYIIAMLRPADPFTLLFFSIIFGFVKQYLILMIFVSFFMFVKNFTKTYKRLSSIPR